MLASKVPRFILMAEVLAIVLSPDSLKAITL